MRHIAAVTVLTLTVAASAAASGTTSLRIRVWPDGSAGRSIAWTLRCDPVAGTHPRRVEACRLLASLANPFAPVPPNLGCTQIYGGPQVALVTGTFREGRVWARFKRSDGCQIARWQRVRVLLTPTGA
jgi:Subtilisin inhibitor-like